jgi:hypothetical protein
MGAGLAGAANSQWTVVSTPNRGTVASGFNGVAGVSEAEVWAVGHSYDTRLAAYRTLIERWNGTRWSIVSSPNRGTDYNDLNGVAVEPTGTAWAVGYSRTPYQALVLGWTGSAWQMATLPNLGSGSSQLAAVTAVDTNDVWAVGWINEAGRLVPLTLHWNGSAWTRVPSALPSGSFSSLSAVAAAGPDDVWAGGYVYVEGRHRAFVEHWNGASWNVVPFPRRTTGMSFISSLSALPSGEVWAAGEDNGVPVVARWDGLRWTAVGRPGVGTGRNVLSKIVVRRADDVWVAGYTTDPTYGNRTVIRHWNGAAWSTDATPNPGTYPGLFGLTAMPSGRLWAVGLMRVNESDQTLAMQALP